MSAIEEEEKTKSKTHSLKDSKRFPPVVRNQVGHGEEEDEEGPQLHLQSQAFGVRRRPDAAVRPAAVQDLP